MIGHAVAMRRRSTPTPALVLAAALALAALLAACGGGSSDTAGPTTSTGRADDAALVVSPANYELLTGSPQRVIAGVQTSGDGRLLAFGTVEFTLSYLGTRERPETAPSVGPKATARYLPVPGQKALTGQDRPRLGPASQGVGVYGADAVVFDRAGFWRLTVAARIDDATQTASGVVEVKATPVIPAPGTPAPRTANPVGGAAGTPPGAIDSRAEAGGAIPDELLHRTSIADAIAAGKPLMVVVSTPVYCQSRFCGPITDSVEALAKAHGDSMAFVHLEVWKDFEKKVVNPFAAEWIFPTGASDANEPWVFVVDRSGLIAARYDNVATDAELDAAVKAVLAS